MKNRPSKQSSNMWLRAILPVGIVGIGLFCVILALIAFNFGQVRDLLFAPSLATSTGEGILPLSPTETSFPTSTAVLNPLLTMTTTPDPAFEFDPATANQSRPEDVAEEVVYFGLGAGTCKEASYPIPAISQEPEGGELWSQSTLIACGWEKDEILTGTVLYPDGRISTQSIPAEADGDRNYAILSFTPLLEDPPGTYTFTLEGEKGTVTATAEFHQPVGPHLYQTDASHILLYQFAPQEFVRLVCYDSQNGTFLAWQEIEVDSSGNLLVAVKTDQCAFAALGELSGEVHILDFGRYDAMSNVDRAACGGLLSRIKVYSRARVSFRDGSTQPVRAEPGNSQEILMSLSEGTVISTTGNAACADGGTWWPIYTDDGRFGWIVEDQNGIYLLEPEE